MRIPLLLCAAALLAPLAKADKFWLSDPDAEVVEGSKADMIEGVLLETRNGNYVIRVVGGRVVLPVDRVFRRDADGLDLDAIVKAEAGERERLAAIDTERRLRNEALRLERRVAAEASASRSDRGIASEEARRAPPTSTPAFDPVVGFVTGRASSQSELLQELQLAWTLTKDRRYLKALRRMRRMR